MRFNIAVAGGLLFLSATVTNKQAGLLFLFTGLGIATAGLVMLTDTN